MLLLFISAPISFCTSSEDVSIAILLILSGAFSLKILRENAPDKINKIAIETSSELVQKLIGAEINNSSISAIVDDLSRRNGDKYYGN